MISFSPRHWLHLGKRLWGSVRASAPTEDEQMEVRQFLLDDEFTLWMTMDWRDQRHALQVAHRFASAMDVDDSWTSSTHKREAMAAALLHDVGKAISRLSTVERVMVNVIGGRTERFRQYLEHESLGLDLCRRAGSAQTTLDFLGGKGDPAVQNQLRWADEI